MDCREMVENMALSKMKQAKGKALELAKNSGKLQIFEIYLEHCTMWNAGYFLQKPLNC